MKIILYCFDIFQGRIVKRQGRSSGSEESRKRMVYLHGHKTGARD